MTRSARALFANASLGGLTATAAHDLSAQGPEAAIVLLALFFALVALAAYVFRLPSLFGLLSIVQILLTPFLGFIAIQLVVSLPGMVADAGSGGYRLAAWSVALIVSASWTLHATYKAALTPRIAADQDGIS